MSEVHFRCRVCGTTARQDRLDEFARAALPGLLAGTPIRPPTTALETFLLVQEAYAIAELMLVESARHRGEPNEVCP